jgi:nitrite reductase/ring-hydroxylating ferredoxin subunit
MSEIYRCLSSEVPDGRYIVASAGGVSLLICRVAGRINVVENKCSHREMPLAGGRLMGTRLVCPAHSAAFDVTTGKPLSYPAIRPIRVFASEEADGIILVSEDDAVEQD